MSNGQLDPVYESGYHTARHRHLIEDNEYFHARARAAARLYFKGFPTPYGAVLEFGCGIGQNIADIPGAVGYDVSGEARAACRARGLTVIDALSDIKPRSYDYVLCRHALEHLEEPLVALQQMFSFLKDDGILILVLPKERHKRVPTEPDLNQHLFCWNFRTINNLIYRAGGAVIRNDYESVLGYRALLPLRRLLGSNVYYYATLLVGRLFRVTELVIWAKARR